MSDTELAIGDPSEMDALRDQVRAIARTEKKTITALAEESGIKYGTFSAWVSGTYQGRNEDVAAKAAIWLGSRGAKTRVQALMPRSPGFVETQAAQLFRAVMTHAQYMPDFTVLSGDPGVGKTVTCRQYRDTNPNVWLITCEPCGGSARALLEDIAAAMQINTAGVSASRLSKEISRRVRGCDALLIIDEAQHLVPMALDQLRTLHDLAAVGVVLSGNETVHDRLAGNGRTIAFATLKSRVGMRARRQRATAGDIDPILDAWHVTDAAVRKQLGTIARRPGALRAMDKTLRLAHQLAKSDDDADGVLGAKHVQAAYERLSDSEDAPRAQPVAGRRDRIVGEIA